MTVLIRGWRGEGIYNINFTVNFLPFNSIFTYAPTKVEGGGTTIYVNLKKKMFATRKRGGAAPA